MKPYDSIRCMKGQTRLRRVSQRPPDPFWDLVATARRLQGPGGCAWDRAQTLRSLVPYLVEETWEVFEAVQSRRPEHLQEELGDALYTVLFLTLLAERRGVTDLRTVLVETRRKMIRRHPHVFGRSRAATPRDAYATWQAAKRRERKPHASRSKVLRPLLVDWWDALRRQPQAAPALRLALSRLQRANEQSRRPSARLVRAKGRSSSPAPDP